MVLVSCNPLVIGASVAVGVTCLAGSSFVSEQAMSYNSAGQLTALLTPQLWTQLPGLCGQGEVVTPIFVPMGGFPKESPFNYLNSSS